MPTISEPLTDLRNQSFEKHRALFIKGTIGPATFHVTLRGLGLSDNDARSEIALALMERPVGRP